MVLKTRLIPTLLLKNGRLVKTIRFQTVENGLGRDVGHCVKAPMVYDAQLADELIYLDMHASIEGRGTDQIRDVVAGVVGECFMPLTAGGGISTLEDIRSLLKAGADKVSINTAALLDPGFVSQAASAFGSQCIVVSIDARRVAGRYEVYSYSGTRPSGLEAPDWARQVEAAGAGGILLTSIDRDGTREGYDLELVQAVSDTVRIPVIASGGVGKLQDFVDGIVTGHASAVAAASLFHFTDQSPIKAKAFMKRYGIKVR